MSRTKSGIVPTLLGAGGGTSRAASHVGLPCFARLA
jgi:hypothetical protein